MQQFQVPGRNDYLKISTIDRLSVICPTKTIKQMRQTAVLKIEPKDRRSAASEGKGVNGCLSGAKDGTICESD